MLGYMAKHVIDGEPVDPESIVGYDLLFADSQPPRRFGADQELFASGRLDNLSSVHAGLTAWSVTLPITRMSTPPRP